MNNKSEIVKTFNEKLVEFVKDLILLYNDNDLYNFKNSINMITLIDERKPIRIFRDVIVKKYKTQLFTRDEKFFLDHHYEDEMACREQKEEVDMSTNLVVKIKSYWKDLTDENKEIIWKYFKLLVILCEKYFAML